MSYGFDPAFLKLNDLRMYIATVGNGNDKADAVSTLMDDPGVKTMKAGNHQVFKTQPEYVQRSGEFVNKIKSTACLYTAEGQVVPFGGKHIGSTCIVLGCGEGANMELVRKAREAGAVIIALGNAIHLCQDADYWIGVRRPPAYVNHGFLSSKVTAIYPEEHKDKKLWMSSQSYKNWSNVSLSECPNILFYRMQDAQHPHGTGVEDFFDAPSISTLGVHTSLTIGLTFAACAGFRNIVMHGVSFSEKYAFEEDVYPNTALRKVHTYGLYQKSIHARLWAGLADRYVMLWATSDVPLDAMRLPEDSLYAESISYSTQFSKANNAIAGISEPVPSKVKHVEEEQKMRRSMLTPTHIADKVDAVLEAWPKRLKGKEVFEEARDKLDAELQKKGVCTGCAKSKLFVIAHRTFAEAALKGQGKARSPINLLWKKVFPDNLNIMSDNVRVLHPNLEKKK